MSGEEKKASDHYATAHNKSILIATLQADPILEPRKFKYVYWISMAGFGFRPYSPGMSS